MKPAPFTYHAPRSLDALTGLLGRCENARILAGGQSLMPMMNMRFVMPDHVIDINRIAAFATLAVTDDRIAIGATVRQAAVAASAAVRDRCPLLIEALGHVGHMQTRSRGTLCGSLCHLDPAAEMPVVATACDAELTIAGPRGERRMSIHDWPLAYMTPNLEPDEALIGLSLPLWPSAGDRQGGGGHRQGHAFVEFARRHGDFAVVCVAALLELDGAGRIARAALALGGVDSRPRRLRTLEEWLAGRHPDAGTIRAAAAEAAAGEAMEDAYYSQAYRRRLAGVLTERALATALRRARNQEMDGQEMDGQKTDGPKMPEGSAQ